MYTYIYIYIHPHTPRNLNVYLHIRMYSCLSICIYAGTSACRHVRYIYICICMYTYIYTYVHIHIYIYIYTHAEHRGTSTTGKFCAAGSGFLETHPRGSPEDFRSCSASSQASGGSQGVGLKAFYRLLLKFYLDPKSMQHTCLYGFKNSLKGHYFTYVWGPGRIPSGGAQKHAGLKWCTTCLNPQT